MENQVDIQITQEVIAALAQQTQRLNLRLQNANNATRVGLEQFAALQQQSLKFRQAPDVQQFLEACCPNQVPIKAQTFEKDKFVDGSLSYTPKLLTRQLLQQTAVQLASTPCANKQQVIQFAQYWTSKALKTSTISSHKDDVLAEIKQFEINSWQKYVAVYAVAITPHVFMNEELEQGLDNCTIVGCLAADMERLKLKL